MKEEIVKIETVPQKLSELEKRKEELTQLVSDTSLITINGINDVEGYKTADKNRKLVKKEISSIEKSRKEIKAPVLKIGTEIDDIAKELTAILEPESKRLISITKAHEQEVEAEKQRQIQEHKEKIKERLRMICEIETETDGYNHAVRFETYGESINNDEIELLTDDKFTDFYNEMVVVANKIKEQERIEEEKKLELLSYRKQQMKLIIESNHWADISDKELLELSDNDFNRIVNDRNCDLAMFSNNKSRGIDFLLSCGYKENEDGFNHDRYGFVGKLSLEGLNNNDFNSFIECSKNNHDKSDTRLKQELEQKKEAERLRVQAAEQEKAQKLIEQQQEEIRQANEKIRLEAERLEQERKDKEAKELAAKKALEDEEAARKAKIKAEKEAEEKRKADVERQRLLKESKSLFVEAIEDVEKMEDILYRSGLYVNLEVMELAFEFDEQLKVLKGAFKGKINNL